MARNYVDNLPSAEKHVAKLMERFARIHGDRVRSEKVMELVEWNEFNMLEIREARNNLVHRGMTKEEGDFIYRLWH